jgi:cytochrome P450
MSTPDLRAAGRLPWCAADPYPFYEAARRRGDIVWNDDAAAWLVLGYRPAREILAESGWTSNPLANPNVPAAMRPGGSDMVRHNMLFTDGPDHQRLRGAVRDVFTRSFTDALRAGIEAIAADTIDAILPGQEFDFMTEIALPLPIAVAAAWLGLDIDAAKLLREESPAISQMLGDPGDPTIAENGAAALATLLTEFLPLSADRRTHPTDDLLSYIATSTDLDLDLEDVVSTAILIAVAGHETTANLLGAAMIRLLTPHPDGTRPTDSISTTDQSLTTELLRLDGPAQAVMRTATTNHTLGDVTIKAGEPALVAIAAANRDPAVYTDPEQLQPNRAGPAPLSFGHGAHYCLGSALARLEITAALDRILTRTPVLAGPTTWRGPPPSADHYIYRWPSVTSE